MASESMNGNGQAVTKSESKEPRRKCPKLDMSLSVGHLLDYEYQDDCPEKHKCDKCGVFRKDPVSGKIYEVQTLPSKPPARDRSVKEVMKRTHGCLATREKIIRSVSAGIRH